MENYIYIYNKLFTENDEYLIYLKLSLSSNKLIIEALEGLK